MDTKDKSWNKGNCKIQFKEKLNWLSDRFYQKWSIRYWYGYIMRENYYIIYKYGYFNRFMNNN